jgi:hypothetical protein
LFSLQWERRLPGTGRQVPSPSVSHTKGFPEPGKEVVAFPALPLPAYFKPPEDATGGKDLKTKELRVLGTALWAGKLLNPVET